MTKQTILLTGGNGFLGSHIHNVLKEKYNVYTFSSSRHDLCDYNQTRNAFYDCNRLFGNVDYVIHCAGFNGGIEFNRLEPAKILANNTYMALNIHQVATEFKVSKLLSILSSCAYPDLKNDILTEDSLWNGPPNKTIQFHAHAKRMLQACAESYHTQYNLDAVTVCITNLFGPNDTFNLTRTKVVGAVIRKVVEAKLTNKDSIEFWGTGAPLREFMYVKDAALAVVEALFKYDNHTQPLNIGSNSEISIKELVETTIEIVGYEGQVKWLTDKADGQMRKLLDSSTMRSLLEVEVTPFKDALTETINWYRDNKDYADSRK